MKLRWRWNRRVMHSFRAGFRLLINFPIHTLPPHGAFHLISAALVLSSLPILRKL
ncbi:hypothetical protein F9C07_12164 [Aspergillus flavus]|uniref:Uncharacterized protein n=1 Tax=Aspergillus flavus (strain ATCC 200026 / FGSC A1120 / IAM 13836 / NRRL 3357 / JCM 12722 / SRRC 167) TaxID=332952 RepID=A0A7U2R2J5_ASPFN|nr:hypothetical protein F9C07_12164 [Aspergillus flavus]